MNRSHFHPTLFICLLGLAASCGTTEPPPPVTEAPPAPADPGPPPPKTMAKAPPAGAPHWDYEADGPTKWMTISKDWTDCAGKAQSPIDIDRTSRNDLPAFTAEFKPSQLRIVHHEHMADIVNTGHSVQVNYTEGDTLTIGSQRFGLLQYHFHSPSEHTVKGKHSPMEMHLVHKSADGSLAVVGVFIEEGPDDNAAFDPVWANLPGTKSTEYHLEHVQVDVNDLLPKSTTTYRYDGSLTTPPCSQGVKWIIFTEPVRLSAAQIAKFQAVMKGNNRPTQPLNGRAVVTDVIAEKAK